MKTELTGDIKPGLLIDFDGLRIRVDWAEDGTVGATISNEDGAIGTLECTAQDFVRAWLNTAECVVQYAFVDKSECA